MENYKCGENMIEQFVFCTLRETCDLHIFPTNPSPFLSLVTAVLEEFPEPHSEACC